MARTQLSEKVGAAIRQARKQRGKVMRNIAEHLNTSTAAVGNWESGENLPTTENLIRVADYLSVDAMALARGELIFKGEEPVADAEIVTDMQLPPLGPADIEVRGVTYGGEDGDFTFNGEVQGLVRRPPGLIGVRKVFALNVMSTSMIPRYEPGELIYAGGREPLVGDYVVIETFPEEGSPVGKSFVKRLTKRTNAEIVVEQFNPPKELKFNRYAVKNLWRVIPTRELLGY